MIPQIDTATTVLLRQGHVRIQWAAQIGTALSLQLAEAVTGYLTAFSSLSSNVCIGFLWEASCASTTNHQPDVEIIRSDSRERVL